MDSQVVVATVAVFFIALAGAYSFKTGTREAVEPPSRQRRLLIGLGLGSFNGFIGGLLGVDGGFVVAPMPMALGFPTKRAVATTSFAVTFASISCFAAHAATGRRSCWPACCSNKMGVKS